MSTKATKGPYFLDVNGHAWATEPANGTPPNQNRQSIEFNNFGFQNWNIAITQQ